MGEMARPSVVAEILDRHGIRLARSLGQHFLVDGNVLARILEAADLAGEDTVLEIGPGIGTLTEELCRRARRVVAVEADRRLIPALEEALGAPPNLELVEGDAMRVDLAALFHPEERVKVVSNLPYNVATPLLLHLLRELPQAKRMVVMVQRELADRYVAGPGHPAYGAVSVKIGLLAEARRAFVVPPTVFMPPPKVESAVLRIDRKGSPETGPETDAFFRFVNAAFASRRKMLVNALSGGRDPYCSRAAAETALKASGFHPGTRAEELTREELLAVFRALSSPSMEARKMQ
ncbi:MAG: 16S rRNA (adenine(1518)-N(6)/adenine(1519)-N(6))-dimethyltransferase RsmA [Actinobacteria bacterium]|nr:16S rRNA (adenine(1518)-N(6)/adenine(1519)-N(6))-dimethyltransferase RsmA [Actinomycetota bacterium]